MEKIGIDANKMYQNRVNKICQKKKHIKPGHCNEGICVNKKTHNKSIISSLQNDKLNKKKVDSRFNPDLLLQQRENKLRKKILYKNVSTCYNNRNRN